MCWDSRLLALPSTEAAFPLCTATDSRWIRLVKELWSADTSCVMVKTKLFSLECSAPTSGIH